MNVWNDGSTSSRTFKLYTLIQRLKVQLDLHAHPDSDTMDSALRDGGKLQLDLHAHPDSDLMDSALRDVPFATELAAAQTRFAVRCCHQTLMRSNDLLSERFAIMLTKWYPGIGPLAMFALCMLINGGKTNKSGWLQHVFLVPDLLDYERFFQLPILRAQGAFTQPLACAQASKLLKELLSIIMCEKVTHEGRAQGQRELDDAPVPLEGMKMLAAYKPDRQAETYLSSIAPVLPMAAVLPMVAAAC